MEIKYVEKINNLVKLTIEQRQIPTPLIEDGVITIDKSVISLCGTTVMIEEVQMVSNFLLVDCQLCPGEPDVGHTQYTVMPGLNFQSKTYASAKTFTPLQIATAKEGRVDWIRNITVSQQRAWEAMLERVALYGDPIDGIPGFLWGSGIPQIADANNFFDGSMTGAQMVTALTNYASVISENTSYTYNTAKMLIPSNLVKILVQTTFNTVDARTALDVLKERLALLPGGAVSMYSASSLVGAKAIIMLPDDEKAVALHATDLTYFTSERDISVAGATAGIVALIPAACAVVRLV